MILTPKELGRLAEHVKSVTDRFLETEEWEVELRKEVNNDPELPSYDEITTHANDALEWLIEYYTATFTEN